MVSPEEMKTNIDDQIEHGEFNNEYYNRITDPIARAEIFRLWSMFETMYSVLESMHNLFLSHFDENDSDMQEIAWYMAFIQEMV